MQVIDILNKAPKPIVSYEVIPPYRGKSLTPVYNIIDDLIEFDPAFIDVTSHAATPMYIERGDGGVRQKSTRRRPGTIGLCAAIKYRYNIETVPHILCEGFSKQETEDALIELSYLGIDNVLALTGDPIKHIQATQNRRSKNKNSLELVNQISQMNKGSYIDDIQDSENTNFCIGVGAYPEKHPKSLSLNDEIRDMKSKVASGADYIVTQMFFNNEDYFNFVNLCRQSGIEVPIIPGIKLLTRKNQLSSLPKHFSINIPDVLIRDMEHTKNSKESTEVGIDFALKQCEALLQANVPSIHFYVMQDQKHIKQIVSTLKKY